MNLTELLQEVYLLTDRPDLTALTMSAVKAATLKAHRSDFYSKDIYETGVQFTDTNFRQSLDYISLINNYRSLKYFRIVENATDEKGTFLTILTPEEVIDDYGYNKSNIAYIAGRVLEIRSATSFKYALIGAYVLPTVSEDNFSSWVAVQHPYTIIYEAARVVFSSIGQREEASGMRLLMLEDYTLLSQSALTDVGS